MDLEYPRLTQPLLPLHWLGYYPTALNLTSYLASETDYVPWAAAMSGLNYLHNMISSRPGFGQLRAFLVQTLQPLYERLGWEVGGYWLGSGLH